MKDIMDKHAIIKLKMEGHSNRKVAKLLGIDRKTVGRYWNEYVECMEALERATDQQVVEIQEQICAEPKYANANRKKRKFTEEMGLFIDAILEEESEKCMLFGTHKQQLTQVQIYELVVEAGFEISRSTVAAQVKERRKKCKECFIRQDYDFGDRLEYDFGEVKLILNGELGTYYLAVLSSPASNFRWAYLYKNQKQEVFMDSHVQFFKMIGGVHKEVVYDNMRNVVTKFIGRHEKELNANLLKLSMYYEFIINVTNCFSGNEKGHVEGSVKYIRNKVFAKHYQFKDFEEASIFLQAELVKLNADSQMEQEQRHLIKVKPPLELATCYQSKVNKYSFIRVENNFYSVPEYLVGKILDVKVYYNRIQIYHDLTYICEHKKTDGMNAISIDINHYLCTFMKKPGAIKNSLALKSIPILKSIYDTNFNKEPRKFIELLQENKEKTLDEVVEALEAHIGPQDNIIPFTNVKKNDEIKNITRNQMYQYNQLCVKGE
ncbi:MAG: IS21 family transposase [Eubacteriales bacterium]